MALVVIAIALLLAAQCSGQPTSPSTLYAPYIVSIGVGAPTNGPLVLLQSADQDWTLELELDAEARCALTVRRVYDNPVGRNVWTANYFSGTPSGATKCTLEFTKQGDLELYMLYRQQTYLLWSSGTGNKGVTKMTLANRGIFQLQTTKNETVFSSYNWKEFAIVETQTLRLWESLKNPDTEQPETDDSSVPVLMDQGAFVLAFDKSRDLVLRTTDKKPLVYWTLKSTFFKGGDLSQVAYAAVNPNNLGGIGLFTNSGKLVWSSTQPAQGYDAYFGIDKYGNLKDYFLYKGIYWGTQFQAITGDCNLPSFCGFNSLCNNSQCSCPPEFVRTGGPGEAPFCEHPSAVNPCKWKHFVELKGYDTVFDMYATPVKVSLASCKASCLKSACNCAGFSYDTSTSSCFQYESFKTIRYTSGNQKFVYIKVT